MHALTQAAKPIILDKGGDPVTLYTGTVVRPDAAAILEYAEYWYNRELHNFRQWVTWLAQVYYKHTHKIPGGFGICKCREKDLRDSEWDSEICSDCGGDGLVLNVPASEMFRRFQVPFQKAKKIKPRIAEEIDLPAPKADQPVLYFQLFEGHHEPGITVSEEYCPHAPLLFAFQGATLPLPQLFSDWVLLRKQAELALIESRRARVRATNLREEQETLQLSLQLFE